jgi:hypothetical protein
MATHATHPGGGHARSGAVARREGTTILASGWTMFASVLMIFGGLFAVAQGATVLNNNVFGSTQDYIFQYGATGWGWIHLVLGVVIALAGFALMARAPWARSVGVVLAGLGALANFLWLPQYPLWGTVLLAVNVLIMWSLCAGAGRSRRELEERSGREA